MTVQQLIDGLMAIEDKTITVFVQHYENLEIAEGLIEYEANDKTQSVEVY